MIADLQIEFDIFSLNFVCIAKFDQTICLVSEQFCLTRYICCSIQTQYNILNELLHSANGWKPHSHKTAEKRESNSSAIIWDEKKNKNWMKGSQVYELESCKCIQKQKKKKKSATNRFDLVEYYWGWSSSGKFRWKEWGQKLLRVITSMRPWMTHTQPAIRYEGTTGHRRFAMSLSSMVKSNRNEYINMVKRMMLNFLENAIYSARTQITQHGNQYQQRIWTWEPICLFSSHDFSFFGAIVCSTITFVDCYSIVCYRTFNEWLHGRFSYDEMALDIIFSSHSCMALNFHSCWALWNAVDTSC